MCQHVTEWHWLLPVSSFPPQIKLTNTIKLAYCGKYELNTNNVNYYLLNVIWITNFYHAKLFKWNDHWFTIIIKLQLPYHSHKELIFFFNHLETSKRFKKNKILINNNSFYQIFDIYLYHVLLWRLTVKSPLSTPLQMHFQRTV